MLGISGQERAANVYKSFDLMVALAGKNLLQSAALFKIYKDYSPGSDIALAAAHAGFFSFYKYQHMRNFYERKTHAAWEKLTDLSWRKSAIEFPLIVTHELHTQDLFYLRDLPDT